MYLPFYQEPVRELGPELAGRYFLIDQGLRKKRYVVSMVTKNELCIKIESARRVGQVKIQFPDRLLDQ